MEAYHHLAKTYNGLMSDVDYCKWAKYIHELLGKKKSRIFEVGCGTGNVTCQLYDLGHDIIASDISAEMLDVAVRAAKKKGREITFVQQDMRSIRANGQFDAVVSACDGPNYIDIEGVADFGAAAFSVLKHGGVLLFDISTAHKLTEMDGQVYFDDSDDVTCIWQNQFDKQQKELTMDVTIFERSGQLFKRSSERHVQYAHEIDEIREIMNKAGFVDIRVYEAFSYNDFSDKSDRVQFLCHKE